MIELVFPLIFVALLFCGASFADDKDLGKLFSFICFLVLIVLLVNQCSIAQKPTAMDVYQGNTILEKTVIDGTVTDSCVIFKK